ncbi:cytochrome P450 82A3-like [Punica granatum]|uniref:Cytochrome P450 82A3-like n=1 Tax=Punica granatum TaxID=22663 RepID=A0A6P8D158_PUNGR|nr:cytochrome P450 82A3-like [Punica granatum]
MAPNAGGSWPLLSVTSTSWVVPSLPTWSWLGWLTSMARSSPSVWASGKPWWNAWAVAKECLTTNDPALATRPKSVSSEVMTYNYAMIGFSLYGPYWRQVRKIVTL